MADVQRKRIATDRLDVVLVRPDALQTDAALTRAVIETVVNSRLVTANIPDVIPNRPEIRIALANPLGVTPEDIIFNNDKIVTFSVAAQSFGCHHAFC